MLHYPDTAVDNERYIRYIAGLCEELSDKTNYGAQYLITRIDDWQGIRVYCSGIECPKQERERLDAFWDEIHSNDRVRRERPTGQSLKYGLGNSPEEIDRIKQAVVRLIKGRPEMLD